MTTKKTLGFLTLSLFALMLSGCTNSSAELEESDQLIDEQENVEESEEEASADVEYYENTTFGYKINLADGYDVSTEGVAAMPVVHNESIWLAVIFDDGGIANLNSMDNEGTFPELRDGRINLTAEEYVDAWWNDNKNDDNPYVKPVLGSIFQKTFNGITWYGFTVDVAYVSEGGVGGGVVQKPMTVLVAKNNEIFYRWQFDADLEEQVDNMLGNFEFTN
ncbi:hypothetical protein KA119_00305 [Candidatus Gracilibacteria bacterium]|nr:hypothetical protein [Candidatus Gracilibacteria bacterium]